MNIPNQSHPAPTTAFSRTELLATLASLLLLACVVLPILAAADPAAAREQCRNNLHRLGQAFQAWLKDHDNRPPWRLTLQNGGTFDMPGNGNAWIQLVCLSNQLESPKLLACPADRVTIATNWTRNPQGGFLHARYRANALSYFVGLDVRETAPKSLLSGDPNLQASAYSQSCDYANVNTATSLRAGDKSVAYTQALHGDPGQVLFYDGQVAELTSAKLRQALPKTDAVHDDNHVLMPR